MKTHSIIVINETLTIKGGTLGAECYAENVCV